MATSAMSTITTNDTIAARSRRSRSHASRAGLRPWIRDSPSSSVASGTAGSGSRLPSV